MSTISTGRFTPLFGERRFATAGIASSRTFSFWIRASSMCRTGVSPNSGSR
ncbi:hypothetical protein [Promicromonospora iranensis]|uniref:Uncharacterized protein n=1 Tax=Promicromonospora iranensis TaxID=1105144 RepID=A0ABU2CSQ9_9MICO|nr:hypothetical protein [Promicromonospora iranensis]MDR7384182.1 hypothetical protein [Promicromonospora iranensis]